MREMVAGCIFCRRDADIVWSDGDFYLQLDDAPIVEGHALLCPREHYTSIADLPPSLISKLDDLLDELVAAHAAEYGPVVMFEHGRTGHCVRLSKSERMCNHAHLHLLPLDADLDGAVKVGSPIKWRRLSEIVELASDVSGYILVRTGTEGKFIPVMRSLPPHYLRTVSSSLAGCPELAAWEAVMHTERSQELKARAAEKLFPRYASLPLAAISE
jgi:diadenosine tetraphosphate (Ap4A) HIT family hydrolase